MQQDDSNQQDTRGKYITLTEFSVIHPEYPRRALLNFIDRGMPADMRGGLYFVYEQQTLEWIDANVDIKTTFIVKGA